MTKNQIPTNNPQVKAATKPNIPQIVREALERHAEMIKNNPQRTVYWIEPIASDFRDNGENSFSCLIDYRDGFPEDETKFVYNEKNQQWTMVNSYFACGKTGTKFFLQYDHEFPTNLCRKMNSMDNSEAYKN